MSKHCPDCGCRYWNTVPNIMCRDGRCDCHSETWPEV